MPPPAGAVGFKLADRASGKWLTASGPSATEPAPTPFVPGLGSADETIFSQDATLPDPTGPVVLYFYDAAGKRVLDPKSQPIPGTPLFVQAPPKLILVLNKALASWPTS